LGVKTEKTKRTLTNDNPMGQKSVGGRQKFGGSNYFRGGAGGLCGVLGVGKKKFFRGGLRFVFSTVQKGWGGGSIRVGYLGTDGKKNKTKRKKKENKRKNSQQSGLGKGKKFKGRPSQLESEWGVCPQRKLGLFVISVQNI